HLKKLCPKLKHCGITPICSYCHNIRNEEGAWDEKLSYISSHSDAKFSHGLCPECLPEALAKAGLDETKND
ncbi:MAG: hypothetical protein OQK75_10970, partial [Gammaproteobacteria bacterium]|nr:hypothetical protein [Gammaproteobacteria bacterium]